MTEDEQRIAELIRNAFDGITLGDGVGLSQTDGIDDYATATVLSELREKDEKNNWDAIPSTDLDRHAGLSFFDAEGMRFHLPAFLIADLEGSLFSATVVFHLTYIGNDVPTRFELLSEAQRNAVRQFLLLRLSDPNCEFERPLIEEALRRYWV